MPSRLKLTKKVIEKLGTVDRETWIMDSEIIGFGVRQRPNARPSYAMRWKDAGGYDRKMTIMATGKIDLENARNVARQRFGEIAHGLNPIQKRKDDKVWSNTIDDLVEAVMKDMSTKGRAQRYLRDWQQQYRDHVSGTIGSMTVKDVSPTDVDRILQKLRQTPALHNRVRALLSKLFKLAVRWGYRVDDPTLGSTPQQEKPRDRLLSNEEMDNLLVALDRHPCQSSDVMRLLYLTGSRPKELFTAKWKDLDLDKGTWTKPAQYVKQRRTHKMELHSNAVVVFRKIWQEQETGGASSPFVFPSNGAAGHLTTIKKYASTIFKEAGIENVRPYDLRKAFASRLVAAGVDLTTVMSLTGHTQVSVLLKHYSHVMEGKQGEALTKIFG